MALDCKGNRRGRCLLCNECQLFTPWAKNIRCAYCDCPPTKHENISLHETISGDAIDSPTFVAEHGEHQEHSENKLVDLEDRNTHQHFHGTSESHNTDRLHGPFARGISLFCQVLHDSILQILFSNFLFCMLTYIFHSIYCNTALLCWFCGKGDSTLGNWGRGR